MIKCSWEDSGIYEDEIIRIFSADGPMPLRWRDAHTVEVGLPAGAHFSPPRDTAEHFGHTIRYVYRPMASQELGPLQCFGPPEDYRKMRTLNGPEKRDAHSGGWISYGSDETCMLVAPSVSAAPRGREMAAHFIKTATARLPHGTTDLVLVIAFPHAVSAAPQVRLSAADAPLVSQSLGPGRGYRLAGAAAERVFRQLSRGEPIELLTQDEQAALVGVKLSDKELAAASAAFEKCVRAFHP